MNKPVTVLTRKGYQELQEKLGKLKSGRNEIAESLKEARGHGDLSENAEYDEAKNDQTALELQILEIEETLKHAHIINDEDISTEYVGIGTTVKILDMELDEEMEFKMVGTKEADIDSGKISDESPIGKAIMDRVVGEEVDIETPSGQIKMKILEIRKDD